MIHCTFSQNTTKLWCNMNPKEAWSFWVGAHNYLGKVMVRRNCSKVFYFPFSSLFSVPNPETMITAYHIEYSYLFMLHKMLCLNFFLNKIREGAFLMIVSISFHIWTPRTEMLFALMQVRCEITWRLSQCLVLKLCIWLFIVNKPDIAGSKLCVDLYMKHPGTYLN